MVGSPEVEYKILLHVETRLILSPLLSICLHIQYILFLFLKLLQVFVLCTQGILKLISIYHLNYDSFLKRTFKF